MTSADGTTFIISYEYVDENDLELLTKNSDKTTPSPPETDPAAVAASEANDREFLRGFFSGANCLIGGTGWWKYELCYGKHVVQFHVRFVQDMKIDDLLFLLHRKIQINEYRLH